MIFIKKTHQRYGCLYPDLLSKQIFTNLNFVKPLEITRNLAQNRIISIHLLLSIEFLIFLKHAYFEY